MQLIDPIILYIILFFVVSIIFATILKKKFKVEVTLLIISLLKTKKLNKCIYFLAKFKKFNSALAVFGIVIGFGLLGVDYYFNKTKKVSIKKRILNLLIALSFLSVFNYIFVGLMIGSALPFFKEFYLFFLIASILFGFAGFSITLLTVSALDIIIKTFFNGVSACPGIGPIIPGVEIPKTGFKPPIIETIIALAITLIVHEFSHGMIFKKAKIKIKSVGLILFGFIPIGAFVEPNEKALEKASARNQLQAYAIGSSSNFLIMIIAIILMILLINPLALMFINPIEKQRTNGIFIESVDENINFCGTVLPASAFGKLKAGAKIIEVNDIKVNSISDFIEGKLKTKNKIMKIKTDLNGVIEEKKLALNDLGLIGIQVKAEYKKDFKLPWYYSWILFLASLITWIWFINLAVAIINFLPVIPFDGGRMITLILPSYFGFWKTKKKRKEKIISIIFGIIILIILLLNAIPYFI